MFRFLSIDQYLTSFLIGFSLMFALHYLLEPTWGVDEKRPRRRRMILNYVIGTLGIGLSFLYLHPHLWFDLLISMAGAGSATVLAHARDWMLHLLNRDRAHGLVEEAKDEA